MGWTDTQGRVSDQEYRELNRMNSFTPKSKIQGPIAVIGDLHGQIEKLSVVLNRLRQSPNFENRWVVFIGDFVDRGPDPKSVIDAVLELAAKHPRTTAIMGNHEFAMCSALGWIPTNDREMWGERWVNFYDADTTFASYGASFGDLDELEAKVPDSHREFLANLPWCVEHPNLLFVHAGLDPGLPTDLQMRILRERDFSLQRPQWLCEKSFVTMDPPIDCAEIVVSGHVRVKEVVMKPRRILVDTTGGEGGELSCVLMPERVVISSNPDERAPVSVGGQRKPANASKSSSWWKLWS